MTSITTKPGFSQAAAEMAVDLFDNWFDPIETEVRARARRSRPYAKCGPRTALT